MTNKNATNDQLSSKEATLFKQILKFYEFKQYKKGNKLADNILKKHPNHGETLAMKGLLISHLGQKEEAHELIKRGIRNNVTSHICWHVYGLLNRSEKNYDEAIKCYFNALKYDKDNLNILRDYSILQLQQRQFDDFAESRNQLLTLRPGNRSNWLGLALSYHLLKRPELAEKVLEICGETVENAEMANGAASKPKFENSEVLLYRNSLLELTGDWEKTLEDLEKIKDKVTDKQSWLERKGELLLKQQKLALAHAVYHKLVQNNPDHLGYITKLAQTRGISLEPSTDCSKAVQFVDELRHIYPRSNVLSFLPLQLLQGAEFSAYSKAYLQKHFIKGVPSTFKTLKSLFSDPTKGKQIEAAAMELNNLSDSSTAGLWQKFFMAQMHDFSGDYQRALELVDEAISIAPTLVELLMFKARVFKHTGDFRSASQWMERARELDLQDRFVNTKSTKYKLRNNEPDAATSTITLFVRPDVADAAAELVELQCEWFFLEKGLCYMRMKQYGKALKTFQLISKHFTDYYDDQFDFHAYSLRRTTMRAYIDMLNFENTVSRHRFYVNAAAEAAHCYLIVAQHPDIISRTGEFEEDDQLSAAERRKAARKAKKAQLKQQSASGSDHAKTATTDKKSVDSDVNGLELLKAPNPLEQASKWLQPLLSLPVFDDARVWYLAVSVFSLQGKFALAWRCLKKLKRSVVSGFYIASLGRFCAEYGRKGVDIDPRVKKVIDKEVSSVLGASFMDNAKAQIQNFKDANLGNASEWPFILDALYNLDAGLVKAALDEIMQQIGDTKCTPKQLVDFYYHLQNYFQLEAEALDAFKSKCKSRKSEISIF